MEPELLSHPTTYFQFQGAVHREVMLEVGDMYLAVII
jgi:hypothetical protein